MKSPFLIFFKSNNSFDGEEKDEQTILLLRKHWFVIFSKMIGFVILALAPALLIDFFGDFLVLNNLWDFFSFFISVYYLILWTGLFYSLTMYTLDFWIVTNKRIIDSTQNGFFDRTVSELHIYRIQDISVNVKGVIETFLHFGDLQVQTAAEEERFNFSQIPNPSGVKDEIMKLAEKR